MAGRPRYTKNEEIVFASRSGRRFKAKIVEPQPVRGKVAILLDGDPFPVMVNIAQVLKGDDMPAATQRGPESRQLAKRARMLSVPGYQTMTMPQLRKAVEEAENPRKREATSARKTVSKKTGAVKVVARKEAAPRKPRPVKKAAKKRTPAKVAKKSAPKKAAAKKVASNGTNPFRVGSNVWKMAEELLRGGKRSEMIKRLKKTMPLHPWSKDKEENPDRAIDKRLLLTAADLQKTYGYKIVREGRGAAGTIVAMPPGRKAVAKSATKKASLKTTTSGKRR